MAGFIKKAIKHFDRQYGSDDETETNKGVDRLVAAPRTPKAEDSNSSGVAESRLEQALLGVMGKTRKVYEHVNLEELMESRGLDWFFPAEAR